MRTSGPVRQVAALAFTAILITALVLVVVNMALLPSASAVSTLSVLLVEAVASVAVILVGGVYLKRKVLAPMNAAIDRSRKLLEGNDSSRQDFLTGSPISWMRVPALLQQVHEKLHQDSASYRSLERVRSEFLGNVSHELRTPIFTLQGYLETLINGAVDDPAVNRVFLERAYGQTRRLNTLLLDLIEISRMESRDMRLSLRYFRVKEFLAILTEEIRDSCQDRGITLEFVDLSSTNPYLLADKQRLRQALENLIDNAVKYNRPDGTVRLEMDRENSSVLIRVRDTGIGIAAEHLPRLFERFYRVDKNRSREIGGTGLGLAIVKHIVLAHKGTIDIASVVGEGSVFTIALPLGAA